MFFTSASKGAALRFTSRRNWSQRYALASTTAVFFRSCCIKPLFDIPKPSSIKGPEKFKRSIMTRVADPQVSFADLEFFTQGIDLDPILKRISDLLDHHPKIVKLIEKDLERGLKKPDRGRCGITAPQVVRSLILMRVKNCDYRELRERIADGYTLCRFSGFYSRRVPKHDAFNRAFNKLRPQTIQAINDLVLRAAVDLG